MFMWKRRKVCQISLICGSDNFLLVRPFIRLHTLVGNTCGESQDFVTVIAMAIHTRVAHNLKDMVSAGLCRILNLSLTCSFPSRFTRLLLLLSPTTFKWFPFLFLSLSLFLSLYWNIRMAQFASSAISSSSYSSRLDVITSSGWRWSWWWRLTGAKSYCLLEDLNWDSQDERSVTH